MRVGSVVQGSSHPARRPPTNDLMNHRMDHAKMLAHVQDRMRVNGFTTRAERQNEFRLRGSVGVLAGRPDVIAWRGTEAWIVDVKTRFLTTTHRLQVLLCMWAIPQTVPAYRGLRVQGRLVCPTGNSTCRPKRSTARLFRVSGPRCIASAVLSRRFGSRASENADTATSLRKNARIGSWTSGPRLNGPTTSESSHGQFTRRASRDSLACGICEWCLRSV